MAMVEATGLLLYSEDNPVLIDEIRPWIKQFGLLGEAGLSMINMEKALKAKKAEEFERSYREVRSIKSEMYKINHQENQNPYQPGIKTASLVIAPMIDRGFTHLVKSYNNEFDKTLKIDADYNPHQLFTNIPELKDQPITLRERILELSPPLEIIRFEPKSFVGFELQEATKVKEIVYKMESSEIYGNLKLEVSLNGKDWDITSTEKVDNQMRATLNQNVKYIRVSNYLDKEVETKIERLAIYLN